MDVAADGSPVSLRRAALALVLLAPLALACLPASHFPDITDTIARRELQCQAITITELETYAFRADGCGKTAFYRCSYGRKSVGRAQCCQQTLTEDAATATFAPVPPDPYCEEHYQ